MSKKQRLGAVLSPLIFGLYKVWIRTLRYRTENFEPVQQARAQGRHVVFVLWHDELFPVPGYNLHLDWPFVTVVSQSRDGEVLARVLQRLGLETARGSSSRGGVRALVSAMRFMKKNNASAVITVDGPKGPRRQVKDGPIYLAHKAKALIVPLRTRMSRRYRFPKSWDKFQIPYPFSTCTLCFGQAYEIEAENLDEPTLAAERQRLQQAMDGMGEE